MSDIEASYYDGRTTRRHSVTLRLEGGGLAVQGEGLALHYAQAQIRTAYRIGKRVRRIELADGASLEADYTPELDALLDHSRGHRHQGLVHGLESRLKYIAIAVVVTIVVAYGFLSWGVPAIARYIAFSLPVQTQDYLGEGTLKAMDKYFMDPSQIPAARRTAIRKEFDYLVSGLPNRRRYHLEFRDSEKIGANAFALPSGTIVVTDGLIKLAKNDGEIEAVLAHEIGHVHYRHSLRGAIQSSSAAVIIALMAGDVASISSFATTLPTLLVNMSYSRDFETEADNYARQLMLEKGIPLKRFATILTRLGQAAGDDGESSGFLSSHPATRERIKAFQ
jgi:Zn-dependent protease with chaperone function